MGFLMTNQTCNCRIVVIAGFTVRSQYYLQAIAANNMKVDHVVLYGNEKASLPGQIKEALESEAVDDLFIADLNENLKETCTKNDYPFTHIDVENVNHDLIYENIKSTNPDLILFSGYGSQIVKPKLIDLQIPILHIHSGWLPGFKGSTTLYYSIINDGKCGVTALILSEKIDSGNIVKKQYYPIPPPGINIDYTYDCAIRADMMIKVLKNYVDNENLDNLEQKEKGDEYYVIHPVLKHLAILKVNNKNNC